MSIANDVQNAAISAAVGAGVGGFATYSILNSRVDSLHGRIKLLNNVVFQYAHAQARINFIDFQVTSDSPAKFNSYQDASNHFFNEISAEMDLNGKIERIEAKIAKLTANFKPAIKWGAIGGAVLGLVGFVGYKLYQNSNG